MPPGLQSNNNKEGVTLMENKLVIGTGYRLKSKKYNRSLYIMMIVPVVLTLIYAYLPMGGLVIAFKDFQIAKGIFGSPFNGLDNFIYLFTYANFWQTVYNTFFISIMKLTLQMVIPLIVALLMNEIANSRYRTSIQTMVYLPHFISWIVVAGMIRDLLSLDGSVNFILESLGMEPVMFLVDKTLFPYVIVLSDAWKSFGFDTIMIMAALTQIDPNLYEAATMDGAGRWKKTLHITIPGIMSIIVLVFILKLGGIVQNAGFDQVVNLYSPTVYETGDILDTLTYRLAFDPQSSALPRYDLATAVGLMRSVVSFVLVSISYYVAHKVADYRIF